MDQIAVYNFLHPSWIKEMEAEIRFAIFGSYSSELFPLRHDMADTYQFQCSSLSPINAENYVSEELLDDYVPKLMADINQRLKNLKRLKEKGITELVPFGRMKKQLVTRKSTNYDKFTCVNYILELPTLHEENGKVVGMGLELTFRSNYELVEWRTNIPLGLQVTRSELLEKEDNENYSFAFILHKNRNQLIPIYKIEDVIFGLGNIYNLPAVPFAGRLAYNMRTSSKSKADETARNKQNHIKQTIHFPQSVNIYKKMNNTALEDLCMKLNNQNNGVQMSLRDEGFILEFSSSLFAAGLTGKVEKELVFINELIAKVPGANHLLNNQRTLPVHQMELVNSYSKVENGELSYFHYYGRNLPLCDGETGVSDLTAKSYGLDLHYLVEMGPEKHIRRIFFSHPPIIDSKQVQLTDLIGITKQIS